MRTKRMAGACLLALGVVVAGCDRQDKVSAEVKELQEAQQESPKVADDLQRQLESAKAEVVRLEEKLALAKQGVTDDVVKEREEVKEALKNDQQRVNEEVKEAQNAAKQHNVEADTARQQLERTPPVREVKAEVKTETQVKPTTEQVEVTKEQKQIPIEQNRVVERRTTVEEPARTREAPAEKR